MSAQLPKENTIEPVDGTVVKHEHLAEALVAAQKEMPAVEKDGTNPHFKSSFTTLGKLIATVRPVLNRHGIALTQMPSQDAQGKPTLVTRLVHSSGESAEETMPLMLAKQDAQSLGSALTYAKRYALAAALAIADQEDDDGNEATSREAVVPPANDKQLEVLSTAMNWLLPPAEAAAQWDAVKAQCGGEISAPVAMALITAIKARKDLDGEESDQGQAPAERQPPAESGTAAESVPDPAPADEGERDLAAELEASK